jgi:hypothetical protein
MHLPFGAEHVVVRRVPRRTKLLAFLRVCTLAYRIGISLVYQHVAPGSGIKSLLAGHALRVCILNTVIKGTPQTLMCGLK